MYVTLWHSDTYSTYADLDDALVEFTKHEYDHVLTFDTETGRTYRYAELELLADETATDIASDEAHNRSLAAAE